MYINDNKQYKLKTYGDASASKMGWDGMPWEDKEASVRYSPAKHYFINRILNTH